MLNIAVLVNQFHAGVVMLQRGTIVSWVKPYEVSLRKYGSAWR